MIKKEEDIKMFEDHILQEIHEKSNKLSVLAKEADFFINKCQEALNNAGYDIDAWVWLEEENKQHGLHWVCIEKEGFFVIKDWVGSGWEKHTHLKNLPKYKRIQCIGPLEKLIKVINKKLTNKLKLIEEKGTCEPDCQCEGKKA